MPPRPAILTWVKINLISVRLRFEGASTESDHSAIATVATSQRAASHSGREVSIRVNLVFSSCYASERQRDPRATAKNQVDAYEKTDHPKPRDGPLRENEEAEQK